MALIFDIETNGLLDEVDTLHCLITFNTEAPEWRKFSSLKGNLDEGIDYLMNFEGTIVGHNVIGYDLPALFKLTGRRPKGLVRDTLTLAALLEPNVAEADFIRARDKTRFPARCIGANTLEAWGYRLGNYKGDFKGPWETCTQEMVDYCEQDVRVTAYLWNRFKKAVESWGVPLETSSPDQGKDTVDLEHRVATILHRQERRGFYFDFPAAVALHAKLAAEHGAISEQLQQVFPPQEQSETFVPKVNNKTRGYVKGVPFTKTWAVPFNPASRQQVAQRLIGLGWKPQEFTDNGQPRVDDDVLEALPFPEAKVLARFFMLEKRLGQLATGREAWLKKVAKDGCVHGRVKTNGAVTGRMTHSSPNMAQVPKADPSVPFGKECRSLFRARPGFKLIGCDADALELRCLAGYMAIYDGGAYIDTVLKGNKEEGTDMHTMNAKALGCDRNTAKTWFYAFIYGAGDEKLGTTLGETRNAKAAGARARARFLASLPALAKLTDAVKAKVKLGYLRGLDGRRIFIRSEHAALNTLLQGAGAILMKRALVILDDNLQAAGFTPGTDYEFVANVHDEWQIEARPEVAEAVGKAAATAITEAGNYYKFRCVQLGNFSIGDTWADTH